MKLRSVAFATIAVASLLSGCDDGSYSKPIQYTAWPKELEDCVVYEVRQASSASFPGGSRITVVRCKNSTTTTTYNAGKTKNTTVVIDGEEYVKQDKQ